MVQVFKTSGDFFLRRRTSGNDVPVTPSDFPKAIVGTPKRHYRVTSDRHHKDVPPSTDIRDFSIPDSQVSFDPVSDTFDRQQFEVRK